MAKILHRYYEIKDYKKTTSIVENAMKKARSVIPQGQVATYIPELGKVDSNQLGICIYPLTGKKVCLGDYDRRFTIQSISKVMMLVAALEICGKERVFELTGAEPSGEAFNSIVELDRENSKPYNPLINSGAIAICGMLTKEISFQDILRYTRKVCNDADIILNEEVYDSEIKTCSRNRSIAYLLESKNIINGDVDDILRFYTKCCSMSVTAESLATMARILCNDGVGEESTKRYMSASTARIVKTLMLTCGMYDGSGTFAINVGIPSKSGVGGGLMSVSDKRAGIGVFGPALDPKGNSIAGIQLLKEISNKLTLNLFYDPEWDEPQKESNFADQIMNHHFQSK
ncbi:MAG: glutaminase A [Clostridia bacterium]|nr:glutaminase A [Clostridia bacterium]